MYYLFLKTLEFRGCFDIRCQTYHHRQILSSCRSNHPEVSSKKCVLKNFAKFTGKHLCQSLFFSKVTLAQVFPCEFCEIFKSTFFYRTPSVAAFASAHSQSLKQSLQRIYVFCLSDYLLFLYVEKNQLLYSCFKCTIRVL